MELLKSLLILLSPLLFLLSISTFFNLSKNFCWVGVAVLRPVRKSTHETQLTVSLLPPKSFSATCLTTKILTLLLLAGRSGLGGSKSTDKCGLTRLYADLGTRGAGNDAIDLCSCATLLYRNRKGNYLSLSLFLLY